MGEGVMKHYVLYLIFIITIAMLGHSSYIGATSMNMSWNGWVMALGKVNEGYSYEITNMTIANNSSVYTVTMWVKIENCTHVNFSCTQYAEKRVTFIVKRDTNTFLLDGKLAFFAFYWPNYTLSRSFYNIGNELKPSITEIYLGNDSKRNYLGKGIDLTGLPRTIEKCTYLSPPPNLTCLKTGIQNLTSDLTFKGPYPVSVQIYYNSDPFGIIKNHPVILTESIISSPQAKEFLRSIPDVSESNPVKVYLEIAGVIFLAGLIIWRLKR